MDGAFGGSEKVLKIDCLGTAAFAAIRWRSLVEMQK